MKTVYSRIFSTGASVALLCAPAAMAEQNVLIDGVTWAVNYTGDFLPNNASSDPAWTEFTVTNTSGSGTATATVAGGLLTINTPANLDQAYAEMNNTTYWNGASGTTRDNTVEFRLKLQSSGQDYDAAGMFMFDTVNYFGFTIHEDNEFTPGNQGYVKLGSGGNVILDVDAFNTYRILTFSDGTANLYINNVAAYGSPVLATGSAPGQNRFNFGDLFSGGGGVSDWDYVRWTNEGAFVPVPEPSSMLMLGLGAFSFLIRRKRQA